MDLRDFLRVIRVHWLVIILLTLTGALAAWGYSVMQPKVYTATTSGYVQAAHTGGDAGSRLVSNQLAETVAQSYLDIGNWRSVAEYVIDDLDLDVAPESIVGQVTVSSAGTVVIHVSAQANTPIGARDLAESWIRGMVQQVDELEGSNAAAVRLIPGDSARLPGAPSSPNTKLNIVLGGLIGLALGLAYAIIRHILDQRVRDPREVERETGVSVIGTLPDSKDLSTERRVLTFTGRGDSASAVAEATRELRTNLRFVDIDNPPRSIVVTSPVPGDGKSTVAANLATSLAAAGEHVVLVDADLRRPMIANMFNLPEGAGLTDLLTDRAELADVAHVVGDTGNLVVIAAGRVPPNPSEVLGSHRMKDLIADLSKHAIVIIDTPPLLPVTDAAVLSTATDGAVVVLSTGKTTYDMLLKAFENLDKARARPLGVVMNKVPRRGAGAAYYGYQYQGDYGPRAQAKATTR
ncbi:polysaccharide biosynthesis tyrosine autokinase [Microbacterium thalassium]|uniref:non-specific protein-tyrosine kinase n=1 Tax=Microbacterium thalassium TaxID=362649 RepID=A0A7X0FQ26_9MICO|nr:polysaccharide biosynthesis tyrosine autokinase [Microbacterium thalassium]MBB6391057.1 capsular exopolysaccharide synthesis family protein [Microbacterium thalassium]GLK23832.1 chromosome partitioning protein [Microbacterium thalassium]